MTYYILQLKGSCLSSENTACWKNLWSSARTRSLVYPFRYSLDINCVVMSLRQRVEAPNFSPKFLKLYIK